MCLETLERRELKRARAGPSGSSEPLYRSTKSGNEGNETLDTSVFKNGKRRRVRSARTRRSATRKSRSASRSKPRARSGRAPPTTTVAQPPSLREGQRTRVRILLLCAGVASTSALGEREKERGLRFGESPRERLPFDRRGRGSEQEAGARRGRLDRGARAAARRRRERRARGVRRQEPSLSLERITRTLAETRRARARAPRHATLSWCFLSSHHTLSPRALQSAPTPKARREREREREFFTTRLGERDRERETERGDPLRGEGKNNGFEEKKNSARAGEAQGATRSGRPARQGASPARSGRRRLSKRRSKRGKIQLDILCIY